MMWHFSASLLTLWLASEGWTREEQDIFSLSRHFFFLSLSLFSCYPYEGYEGKVHKDRKAVKMLSECARDCVPCKHTMAVQNTGGQSRRHPFIPRGEKTEDKEKTGRTSKKDTEITPSKLEILNFQERIDCLLIGEGPFKNMKGLDMQMCVKPQNETSSPVYQTGLSHVPSADT